MFKRCLPTILFVLTAMAFTVVANADLETQLLVGSSASTNSVAYQKTQWYGFASTGGQGYRIILSPLTGNADAYLLDGNFNLVSSSLNTGITQDNIWYGQAVSGLMHIACFGAYNPSSNLTIQVITSPYVSSMSPVTGGSGTLVTLNGIGFGVSQGTNYVMFGSVKATSYPIWTNTQIKVYVPAGVASGAIQAVVYVAAKASNPNNFTANSNSSDGTMYKYDLGRTSSFPNGPTILPLKLKWTYNAGGYISKPPVIANNVAYICAFGVGKLLAVDATTGVLKWSYSRTGFQMFDNTLTVANGVLYITGQDTADGGYTISDMLFAFDTNTGSLKWKYNTKIAITNNYKDVAVFNNVVYFPVGAKIYAVDAINGTLKWTYTSASQNGFSTHCAISNGVIYAGDVPIYNGNSKVYALDAVTGAVKWTYTIPEVGKSVYGISVANGVVYFGTYGSGTWTGALYALDANTGSVKWKNSNHIDVGMVGVANGIVYANVNNGGWHLQAFDANTGVFKWYASNYNYNDASVSNGLVFAGSVSLDVFDAVTGAEKWSYNNFSGYSILGPFVYNGNVYVCANSTLYCFGQ